MKVGVVGQKIGMTRVFQEDGVAVPVTVIEVKPNTITQIKTSAHDGYAAIQVTTGSRKANRVPKAAAGHFAKANAEAGRGLWEFRLAGDLDSKAEGALKVGDALDLNAFVAGEDVDVTAHSRGKGFAGAIKRHNFSMQPASHGNSLAHRAPGSIGQNQTPRRVFKGKKMAGQMGNVRKTVQNQTLVKIDVERGLFLVKGTVPGAPGASVIVKPAVKAKEGDKA
ncbi:MAG: 50S ribosomal protein L3 [marine bacterium B5-7]|nr:MAG: 50S ribosomal protein L3 [marine bacterium B5-7]